MKRALVIALVLACLNVGSLQAEDQTQSNVFKHTFQRLHQGPPTPVVTTRAKVQELWIEQKLDHFDAEEKRTWQMRYLANDEHFQAGGPLFIRVGGEWTVSGVSLLGGHVYDMAKEHNGYLFYTEHRYYGKSQPLPNTSNENIVYLSVNQSLADLAHFITTQKAKIAGLKDSAVILVGGSYSATMVTWFKKMYPDLATGCWASSAPLLAKVNFVEYKEVTGQSIRLVGGDACYDRIQNGIAEMENLFALQRGAEVKAMLQLCEKFDDESDLDIWTLFSEISDLFAGLVQTHNAGQIEKACATILAGSSDLTGVASYVLSEFKVLGNKCNDLSYNAFLASIMDSSDTGNIMRQWTYQTCNEYGWYQTSGSRAQPFGTKFPVTYYTTMCEDAYGSKFTNEYINRQVATTNAFYGGLEPKVENVYMSHGQLDPWRAMGIQNGTEAMVIPNYAHCKDFDSISTEDSDEMLASKQRIAALVREWVAASSTK